MPPESRVVGALLIGLAAALSEARSPRGDAKRRSRKLGGRHFVRPPCCHAAPLQPEEAEQDRCEQKGTIAIEIAAPADAASRSRWNDSVAIGTSRSAARRG